MISLANAQPSTYLKLTFRDHVNSSSQYAYHQSSLMGYLHSKDNYHVKIKILVSSVILRQECVREISESVNVMP